MQVTENLMLQQIQQMAANMATTLPQTGSAGKDQSGSFQDMMVQAGRDSADNTAQNPDSAAEQQPVQEQPAEGGEVREQPQAQSPEKAAAKNQELNGDPNAMQYMADLFRPEIVDVSQEEAPAEALTVETVQAAEMPAVEAGTAEVPVEQAVQAPVEEAEAPVPTEEAQAPVQRQDAAPVRQTEESFQETEAKEPVQEERQLPQEAQEPVRNQEVRETREAPAEEKTETVAVEVKDAPETTGEEPEKDADDGQAQGEAAQPGQQPLFRDVEAAPVKVAERYESVDTQAPDMEEKLAETIRQAADGGEQRIQLTLNPANLGQVTIEMAKDANGVLQVALHVTSGKAEQVLGQHLDGLHAALQAYGQEVKVEVQRNQETPQQHSQNQQQANPDGHNQNQQQQQRQERRQEAHSGDFLQRMRLGLVEADALE